MDTSIFLAKALGIYLVIVSVAMWSRHSYYKSLILEYMDNRGFILLSGVMAFIIGILLVLVHNIWKSNWQILITILAWSSLIKGIVRIIYPEFINKVGMKLISNNLFYSITVTFSFIIGLILCYFGFR